MSEANKQSYELAMARRLFPDSQYCSGKSGEQPDVLVTTFSGEMVGVEVTKYDPDVFAKSVSKFQINSFWKNKVWPEIVSLRSDYQELKNVFMALHIKREIARN